MIAPNNKHKKDFTEVITAGFRNGKSLKDYQVTAVLPKKIDSAEGLETCGKGTCEMRDYTTKINIFTTKACRESIENLTWIP